MGFLISQVLGKTATFAGAAVGGGVAGIAIAYGAGELSKAATSFIREADAKLSDARDAKALRTPSMDTVTEQMEEMAAVSLWADERVRVRLIAGDPPDPPARPPAMTNPPLEDPPGRLRIPAPDDQPAHDLFFNWYEHEGGLPLKAAAHGFVRSSGVLEAFDHEILNGMFQGA